jgi:hypothetical protein
VGCPARRKADSAARADRGERLIWLALGLFIAVFVGIAFKVMVAVIRISGGV